VLWIVLVINAAMFLVGGIGGIAAHTTSPLVGALDMLGDALVYAFSIFVIAPKADVDRHDLFLDAPAFGTPDAQLQCDRFHRRFF
jgi:hypothetical protein